MTETVPFKCSTKWFGMKKKISGAGTWWGDLSMHPETAWFFSEFLEKDLNEFHQIWQIWSKLAASIVWNIWTGDQWIFMDPGWGLKGLAREIGLEAKLKVEMVVPLKTSKDQTRGQKLFLMRNKWKQLYGEVQLAGFEAYLDTKMGDGLWQVVSTHVMAWGDFWKGKRSLQMP